MNIQKENNVMISTVIAFALIPLSGFATDVYLPSFPAMAAVFGTTQGDIQLSLAVFIVSNGIGQLFVGWLLDSLGRYQLSILSLIIFVFSCIVIAFTESVTILLTMRVIQGLTVALIVVSKRAFFMDLYSGDKLKHYTSLFSIMWATAPVIAPFVGGFLQHYWGWESNFYFLAGATFIILILELNYTGETLSSPKTFKTGELLGAYSSKLSTPDFAFTLLILGSAFGSVIVYNMASPFIIRSFFEESPVTIGNCSLFSGLALMAGGLISKRFLTTPLLIKMQVIAPLLLLLSVLLTVSMFFLPNLIVMVLLIVLFHMAGGFTFNTFYTYALGRFSTHRAIVSGIVGGGTYILASVFSYAIVEALQITNPATLGLAYVITASIIAFSFVLFHAAQKSLLAKAHAHPI